jgi:hypothetical protein
MTATKRHLSSVLAVLIASLSVNAWAKCPTESVEVRGQLRCSFKPDYKVIVTLIYKKNQLEGSGEETALGIHDDSFEGRVKFDSFTSYNPLTGHRCDRRPVSVLVRLISAEGEEWDRKMLSFHDEFSYVEQDGQFKLRPSLVLQGWCKP